MFSALIFDFDGTLAQTQTQAYFVLNKIARARGVTLPSFEKLRDLSSREIMGILRVRFWEVPWLTIQARREMSALLDTIEIAPGMLSFLQVTQERKIPLALLSSNSSKNIAMVLRTYGVEAHFSIISAGISIFGKRRALRNTCRALKLPPKQTLYIGDEVRDIEAAKAAGVLSAAVGWGFHSEALLRAAGPDFYFASVETLREATLSSCASH